MRLALLLPLALSAACSCASDPSHEPGILSGARTGSHAPPCGGLEFPSITRPRVGSMRSQSGGVVLADQFAQIPLAAQVGHVIDSYYYLAGRAIGENRERPLEVWLTDEWPVRATTFQRCIVLRTGEEELRFLDLILTHEFVHWHAEDTALQANLPHAVIEGLCEWVAADLIPEYHDDRHTMYADAVAEAARLGNLEEARRLLGADRDAWLDAPRQTRLLLTAVGFVVVDHIGIPRLRALAEVGPVSVDGLMREANLIP